MRAETIAKRVARHQWKAAGEPERDAEPTSVGRQWYEDRALEVVTGLLQLGYRISAPEAGRAAIAQRKSGREVET